MNASLGVRAVTDYGAVNTIASNSVNPIKKALIAYGAWKASDYLNHFSKFNLFIVSFEMISEAEIVKQTYPDLTALFYGNALAVNRGFPYWDLVLQHPEVVLRDLNGNPLLRKSYSWYCLDISKSQVTDFLADFIADTLQAHPLIDGVMLDDVWSGWNKDLWENDPSVVPDFPDFHKYMKGFLVKIKARIGSKVLVANTRDTIDYVTVLDGQLWECAFVQTWGRSVINQAIYLRDASRQYPEKMFVVTAGKSESYEYAFKLLWSYCCTLLIAPETRNVYFAFDRIWSSSHGYMEVMDSDTGMPLEEAYLHEDGKYSRAFENCKVTVDAHAIAIQVQIFPSYP